MGKQNWITVEADISEVQKALEGTTKSLTSIQKQALGIIARSGVKQIRKEIKLSILNKSRSTGALSSSYGFRVKKDGSEANIYPRGTSGADIFPKAFVNNYGFSGPTVRAQNWNFAPKGFVQKTESYLAEGNFDTELKKMVDKTLSKYWG